MHLRPSLFGQHLRRVSHKHFCSLEEFTLKWSDKNLLWWNHHDIRLDRSWLLVASWRAASRHARLTDHLPVVFFFCGGKWGHMQICIIPGNIKQVQILPHICDLQPRCRRSRRASDVMRFSPWKQKTIRHSKWMDSIWLVHRLLAFNLALADKCVGRGLQSDRIIKYYPLMTRFICWTKGASLMCWFFSSPSVDF